MSGRRYIIDILVLTLLIFLLSWVFRRTDPGWFNYQASAWLILPLMLGGRYGFFGGLLAGVVAGIAATASQGFFTETDIRHLLTDNPGYFLAILITGALAGLTHSMRMGNRQVLEERVKELTKENNQLQANNRLYRENEAQLQTSLVSHEISYQSMTRQAETLLDSPAPVEEALLVLLHEQFGLRSAALYRSESGKKFRWVSIVGDDQSDFAPDFDLNNAPDIAKIAIEKQELATCRSLWDEGDSVVTPQPYLAALPQKEQDAPIFLLLIRDMEFESITWESFAKMEAIFQYVLLRSGSGIDLEESTVSREPAMATANPFSGR